MNVSSFCYVKLNHFGFQPSAKFFSQHAYKDNLQQQAYKNRINAFEFPTIILKGIRFYIQTRTLPKCSKVLCFSLNVKACCEFFLMNHLDFATELKLPNYFCFPLYS